MLEYIWYIKAVFLLTNSQICDTIVTGCHVIIINVLRSPSCIAEPRHHHLAVTLLRFCCPTRNSWQSQQDYGLMLNKLHAGTHSKVSLFGSKKRDFAPKMYSDLINFRCDFVMFVWTVIQIVRVWEPKQSIIHNLLQFLQKHRFWSWRRTFFAA